MSIGVFGIVLLAALVHAFWNAVVKSGDDKLLSIILVMGTSGVIAAAVLPFLALPNSASWPYIAVSLFLELGYFLLMSGAYGAADMSQAYPLMRGTAPVLVAIVGTIWLDDRLSLGAWIGVMLICAGILSLTLAARQSAARKGVAFAMANAVVIAAYTLVDGKGVRLSGSPAAYAFWVLLLAAAPLLCWAIAARRTPLLRYALANYRRVLAGGVGALASYSLVLWAMTRAPIAVVAALRETSILFGMAIAALALKEETGRQRLVAAGLITLGAIALRLA